jgi:hypothetical protein
MFIVGVGFRILPTDATGIKLPAVALFSTSLYAAAATPIPRTNLS